MKTKPAQILSRLKSVVVGAFSLSTVTSGDLAGLGGSVQSSSGESVTVDMAMKLATVWACTRLISQTIATLPLGVYERTGAGRKDASEKVPQARLLRLRPNPDMTSVVFWEQMVAGALIQGNSFAEKLRGGGRVVSLRPLVHDRLSWKRNAAGQYEFKYIEDNGIPRPIPAQDILHLPGFVMSGKFGASVIFYGAEVFGSAISANKAASTTFKNGLLQTTYFKMDRILKGKQREDFRTTLSSITGALNAGKPALLEGGMDAGSIGINPDDAQLLESRKHSNEDICRWFGVPPPMVAAGDKASSWASSSEQMNLWFLQYALRPILKRIELMLNTELLSPTQQDTLYFEFAVEGLLRGDLAARQSFYASALQNGWMNRDDVREKENMGKIEGGDIYTVQSNLVPLKKIGENQPDPAASDPAADPNADPASADPKPDPAASDPKKP
jgi:HK97 family phage portal protein